MKDGDAGDLGEVLGEEDTSDESEHELAEVVSKNGSVDRFHGVKTAWDAPDNDEAAAASPSPLIFAAHDAQEQQVYDHHHDEQEEQLGEEYQQPLHEEPAIPSSSPATADEYRIHKVRRFFWRGAERGEDD